jgi:hypothetical protein
MREEDKRKEGEQKGEGRGRREGRREEGGRRRELEGEGRRYIQRSIYNSNKWSTNLSHPVESRKVVEQIF